MDVKPDAMRILNYLLLGPLSLLYGAAVTLRNKCYDLRIFRSTSFPLPVLAVGNITVGGAGKTPHTELLVALLKEEFRVAVLSRGYKRRTKGFRYVETTGAAADNGDEPLQIKQKFPSVTVAVDANRVNGIKRLRAEVENLGAVVLDDAFQHRRVRPSLSLLLIDYNRPVHRDHLLPLGRLRDRRNQLRRADIICVTKCPAQLPPEAQQGFAKNIRRLPHQLLFFTTFAYGAPQPVFAAGAAVPCPPAACLLVTGIASPAPLAQYLREQPYDLLQHLAFRDHHAFTAADAGKINAAARRHPAAPVFTTEKDAVRLRETPGLEEEVKQRLFYLPVTVQFLTEERTPTPEGRLKKQETFKKIMTEHIWNLHRTTSPKF
jgi:tetraacyldisaccharide 4'-kinase